MVWSWTGAFEYDKEYFTEPWVAVRISLLGPSELGIWGQELHQILVCNSEVCDRTLSKGSPLRLQLPLTFVSYKTTLIKAKKNESLILNL